MCLSLFCCFVSYCVTYVRMLFLVFFFFFSFVFFFLLLCLYFFFFFFSSRRRHTRCLSDWSSDVCSSDLRSSPRQEEVSTRKSWRVTGSSRGSPVCACFRAPTGAPRRRAARRRSCASEIGRASCRERGGMSVVAGRVKEKE